MKRENLERVEESAAPPKPRPNSYQIASQWLDDMGNKDGRWNWSHDQAARSLASLLRKFARRGTDASDGCTCGMGNEGPLHHAARCINNTIERAERELEVGNAG